MPIFRGSTATKEKADLQFATRAEAFNYMLSVQLDKGKDPMEAAKSANEFADIFATNMGIPTRTEPTPEGVDRYLVSINKVVNYFEEHPKVTEFITGAFTFAIGAFFGNKAGQNPSPEPPKIESIDITQLN